MSVLTSRPALRWAIPAAALVAIVGAAGVGKMVSANASDGLPQRSPQQLLMDVAQNKVDALSGTIAEKSDLGLPALPNIGEGNASVPSLVTGNHTVRLWYDTPDRVRASLQGTNGESDVIRNQQNVWTWDSAQKTATHSTMTPGDKAGGKGQWQGKGGPSAVPTDLNGAVSQALSQLGTTTSISTDGTAKVAGRSCYELVLTPKDTASKVHQVRLAIDGEKHIPMRVQVYARGSDKPAFEAAFTSVSFAKPDASEFTFKAPAGTKVQEEQHNGDGEHAQGQGQQGKDNSTVVGQGWTSVWVAKGVSLNHTGATGEEAQDQQKLTNWLNSQQKVSGSWGSGRLVQSKLFSALLTDDGRLLVGAVDPQQLYTAAAQSR